MEACLGLGRSQRNLNKQQQENLKLQDQHQHQQQHTQLQQQKPQTRAIITNQNYYTTQQQPPNQSHLVERGQTTNVGALKPELQHEQRQLNEESHWLRQEQQQNVQHNATTTNTSAAATTPIANMHQPTSSTANDSTCGVGSAVQQLPQPQTISFQKNTVATEVTPALPSTVSPTNTSGIVSNANVKTFRKINRQSQQQQQLQQQHQHQHLLDQQYELEADLDAIEVYVDPESHVSFKGGGDPLRQSKTLGRLNHQHQHHHSIEDHHDQWTEITSLKLLQLQQQQQKFQQQQHQHQYLLHQQQQQLEADLDAIDVCVDPEPHVSFKGCGGGLLRQTRTLGRLNHQHRHHHSIEDQHGQWTDKSQVTSLQLLQLQQQQQHDYSYAYYEPGAVMRHTNIPQADVMAGTNEEKDLIRPPPNSIRALLLKGKKKKLLVSPTTRQSYQARLTQQQSHNVAGAMASANCSNISTPENYYEEIFASSTSSSSNSITSPHQLRATSHSAGSLTRTLVEEELRKVQNRHHKILDELNLSVEAMLMPDSPPNISPTDKESPVPVVSVTTASGQPLRLTSSSIDNICDTALVGGPADEFMSPTPNSATVNAGLLQSSCVAADFDSGFSGSSGASYIGTLRLHKTKALMSLRSNNLSSTTTAAAGSNVAAKSQQSASAYDTQCCRSFQRANSNNTNATITSSASSPASATTSSCTIKHLPQIHHNTKQQQRLHLQHQHHKHHDSHLHHHHHHLHQEQQHPHQQHQQSQHINDVVQNSSGFFTRASCGCRILNCAKIRAAEDPGPVVINTQPIDSKARSFWKRKGWRKPLDFSISTSSINDPG